MRANPIVVIRFLFWEGSYQQRSVSQYNKRVERRPTLITAIRANIRVEPFCVRRRKHVSKHHLSHLQQHNPSHTSKPKKRHGCLGKNIYDDPYQFSYLFPFIFAFIYAQRLKYLSSPLQTMNDYSAYIYRKRRRLKVNFDFAYYLWRTIAAHMHIYPVWQ